MDLGLLQQPLETVLVRVRSIGNSGLRPEDRDLCEKLSEAIEEMAGSANGKLAVRLFRPTSSNGHQDKKVLKKCLTDAADCVDAYADTLKELAGEFEKAVFDAGHEITYLTARIDATLELALGKPPQVPLHNHRLEMD